MPITNTNAVAAWTRFQLGRVVAVERGKTVRTARSAAPADIRPGAAGGPAPLGTTNRLAQMLTAMARQTCTRFADRERIRASADRQLETIRALSIL